MTGHGGGSADPHPPRRIPTRTTRRGRNCFPSAPTPPRATWARGSASATVGGRRNGCAGPCPTRSNCSWITGKLPPPAPSPVMAGGRCGGADPHSRGRIHTAPARPGRTVLPAPTRTLAGWARGDGTTDPRPRRRCSMSPDPLSPTHHGSTGKTLAPAPDPVMTGRGNGSMVPRLCRMLSTRTPGLGALGCRPPRPRLRGGGDRPRPPTQGVPGGRSPQPRPRPREAAGARSLPPGRGLPVARRPGQLLPPRAPAAITRPFPAPLPMGPPPPHGPDRPPAATFPAGTAPLTDGRPPPLARTASGEAKGRAGRHY